jgi:hypothetical protein
MTDEELLEKLMKSIKKKIIKQILENLEKELLELNLSDKNSVGSNETCGCGCGGECSEDELKSDEEYDPELDVEYSDDEILS